MLNINLLGVSASFSTALLIATLSLNRSLSPNHFHHSTHD
jgi:hypothetical protein